MIARTLSDYGDNLLGNKYKLGIFTMCTGNKVCAGDNVAFFNKNILMLADNVEALETEKVLLASPRAQRF